jgi:hypothetical protein
MAEGATFAGRVHMTPRKAIPHRLHETIDAIRNFGNFSAHPIDDKTALQIIEVEPEEAGWCLEILEECFQHFFVGPEIAKEKKAALDAKLVAPASYLRKADSSARFFPERTTASTSAPGNDDRASRRSFAPRLAAGLLFGASGANLTVNTRSSAPSDSRNRPRLCKNFRAFSHEPVSFAFERP